MTYKTIRDFIKYHNAAPLILVAVLLVAGVAFAASPKGQQALSYDGVVVTDTKPVPPDTTALQKTDLKKFDSGLRIDTILEDTTTFSVHYTYRTLEIRDNAWEPLSKSRELKIDKKMLGARDLGLYLADQIGQVIDQEMAYLKEVQSTLGQATDPRSSSKYATLVGKTLNQGEKEFDGYEPVVLPPVEVASSGAIQVTPEQVAALTVAQEVDGKTPTEILLSKKEIRDIIVEAVANFLAVETALPVPSAALPIAPPAQPSVPVTVEPEVAP